MKHWVVILFLGLSVVVNGQSTDIVIHRINAANNYNGEIFENSIPTTLMLEGTMCNTLWRYCTCRHRNPHHRFTFKLDTITKEPAQDALKAMWMGHASVLIEIDGKRFLTDPMFSNRTSPFVKAKIFNFLWPKRFYSSERLSDLLRLDGVIISHDHSDHLDYQTIIELGKTGVMFFAPLKVGETLQSWGIDKKQIVELNWWDYVVLSKTHTLVATPARHDSGRSPLFGKRDRTLWCSWVIEGPNHKVFFGGDTGYSPDFKTIGQIYGPFDITFLPIGAYDKNWPEIHINPQEAVEIHNELKGKVLFPIHWGTFNVAIHPWDEPVKEVQKCAVKENVSLCLPSPGKLVEWPNTVIDSKWWVIR
jgi:L-ascorbate metabolism protein UlaG (beta-lactamase superfamily)